MDPISQGVLGASAAQSFTSNCSQQRRALLIGMLSGMAPDLDVLIRSSSDPMLFLEFHRQFTHSLIFIPVGALICAVCLYPFVKHHLSFAKVYTFAFLGYASHGLLDACTSYGTQLFWPFSTARVAWNNVSIVDPLFTLPLVILVAVAAIWQRRRMARLALIFALSYLMLGVIQHQRAESALLELAEQRGHTPLRFTIKPSFGNLILWKLIYEYEGRFYVDAARVVLNTSIIEGHSISRLVVSDHFPSLSPDSVQAHDLERYRWFSDDYLAISLRDPTVVMDVRYSFIPNRIDPLWGIRLTPYEADSHIEYLTSRSMRRDTRAVFVDMLLGTID